MSAKRGAQVFNLTKQFFVSLVNLKEDPTASMLAEF